MRSGSARVVLPILAGLDTVGSVHAVGIVDCDEVVGAVDGLGILMHNDVSA